MPKKSVAARSGAQRNKPKVQKSFELVRQETDTDVTPELEETTDVEAVAATATADAMVSPAKAVESVQRERVESSVSAPATSPKNKVAARRQGAQRNQTRAAALITTEHYLYVRRELTMIAVLAAIMFIIIIAMYFVPGIGS